MMIRFVCFHNFLFFFLLTFLLSFVSWYKSKYFLISVSHELMTVLEPIDNQIIYDSFNNEIFCNNQ